MKKLEIQSSSLEEIIKYAADYLFKMNFCNFFIEDAGLFIDHLNGFPGPYSSYVYKTIGVDGILKLMDGISNRSAYFLSVVGLCFKDVIKIFVGEVKGKISLEARGEKGFGFDPIFIPEGYEETFAQMDLEKKNSMSHRAKALRKMAEYLKKFY